MNSSKVIKSARANSSHEIMISRPGGDEAGGGGFHSLSSLWQSDDQELIAGLGKLAAEKKILEQEAQALKAETEAMIAAAQARVAQIEREAYDKGLAAGKAFGEAEEKARLAKIDALLTAIEGERSSLHAQYEADILLLIKAMVDRVLFYEVTINPQAIEVCLQTALVYAVENSTIVVRLHNQDLERLQQAARERPELVAGYKKIELVADPALALGGCILDTGFGEIDASLESRKAKVFAAIDAVLHETT